MAEITSTQIKDLRDKTGAGMMDCKKALIESGGDLEQAVDWLRKKGLAAAAKKSGRTAAEGLVAVTVEGNTGAVIELNSETDFVARNEQFQALANKSAKAALTHGDTIDSLKAAVCPESKKQLGDLVTEAIGKIGENLNLRRVARLSVKEGVVASYVHNAIAAGLGKIGVLVALESTGDKTKLDAFGKQLAMHIAASRPEVLRSEDVNADILGRERALALQNAQTFEEKFRVFEQKVKPYANLLQKERGFSEKQLEPKLVELTQSIEGWDALAGDTSKDASKSKKLLDAFTQEAAFLLRKVNSYGDKQAVIEKVAALKVEKFYEDAVLMEQIFVIDGKSKIKDAIAATEKKIGAPITNVAFVRIALGEGIEKEELDFAAEVAKAAGAA